MNAPLKYTIFAILRERGDEGFWEYEIYDLLKGSFSKKSLITLRETLIELVTKSWTEEVDIAVYNHKLLRKYRLQDKHKEFVSYMLDTKKTLADANIDLANYRAD